VLGALLRVRLQLRGERGVARAAVAAWARALDGPRLDPLAAAAHIVKPGGKVLLLAACQEGSGAAEFTSMLRQHPSDREFLRQIADAPVTIDQWQLEKLALVTAKAEVLFYVPGLSSEYYSTLWGRAFPTAPDAIHALTSSVGPNATIAVIPEGPYVLAKVADTSARNSPAEAPAPSLFA